MTVALAGRRIDSASDGTPRFPLANLAIVRGRLLQALQQSRAGTLVCSAACGADLLALEVAGSIGMRRRVILPFDPDRFRATSVTDRPGEWGPLFDGIVDDVERQGDLIVLRLDPATCEEAYRATNQRVLDEARMFAPPADLRAIVVWDGERRNGMDVTAEFMAEARRRGVPVSVVSTL